MSRKAGTPNKPKSIDVASFNKELIEDEIRKSKIEVKQEDILVYYWVASSENLNELSRMVDIAIKSGTSLPQGGVSVTNYRANDGSIVMVYCQALVRKDMV